MPVFIPTFENCVERVHSRPRTFFPLFAEQKEFTPDMPDRFEGVFLVCTKNIKAQIFFYIMWGVQTLKGMSTSPDTPFALDTPEDCVVDHLEAQIAGLPWDCSKIHELLFDCPREFTYQQAWTLAAAVIRSYFSSHKRELAHHSYVFALGWDPAT